MENFLRKVKACLKKEPVLQKLDETAAVFIGDLHGDLTAYKKVEKYFHETALNFVFLGDYVDRGPHSIDLIKSLFTLKLKHPERVTLLRGNHETPLANSRYGFKDDVKREFPKQQNLYQLFNEVFAELPIAATLDAGKVIAVHGGIPRNIESIEKIADLPKGIVSTRNHEVLLQLLWNDPNEQISDFTSSMRGPGIYEFGKKTIENFMTNSNANLMVSAHLAFSEGIRFFFNKKLVSIFSTLSYKGRTIKGKLFRYKQGTSSVLELAKL